LTSADEDSNFLPVGFVAILGSSAEEGTHLSATGGGRGGSSSQSSSSVFFRALATGLDLTASVGFCSVVENFSFEDKDAGFKDVAVVGGFEGSSSQLSSPAVLGTADLINDPASFTVELEDVESEITGLEAKEDLTGLIFFDSTSLFDSEEIGFEAKPCDLSFKDELTGLETFEETPSAFEDSALMSRSGFEGFESDES